MKSKLIIYYLFFVIVISGCEKPVQDNIIEPENLVGDYCGSYFEVPNGIKILSVCNITKSENSEEFILNNFAYTNLSVKFRMIDDSIAIPDSIYITDNVAFELCGNQMKRQISGSGLYNIINQPYIPFF